MTVRELVKAALRLLRVIAAGEEPAAEEAADAVQALNMLLHGLKADGADLGFASVALSDDVPLTPEHVRSVKYLLAMEISAEYGAEVSPEVAVQAAAAKATLQAAYCAVPALSADRGLRQRSVAYQISEG